MQVNLTIHGRGSWPQRGAQPGGWPQGGSAEGGLFSKNLIHRGGSGILKVSEGVFTYLPVKPLFYS